jgi:hypothetical protein
MLCPASGRSTASSYGAEHRLHGTGEERAALAFGRRAAQRGQVAAARQKIGSGKRAVAGRHGWPYSMLGDGLCTTSSGGSSLSGLAEDSQRS